MFFNKKWSPKLIFLNDFFFEKIPSIFYIENWLWKYDFGTFWQTIIHCRIVLKQFSLSMSILGHTSCILGPIISEIPQLNWNYCALFGQTFRKSTESLFCLSFSPKMWLIIVNAHFCYYQLFLCFKFSKAKSCEISKCFVQ